VRVDIGGSGSEPFYVADGLTHGVFMAVRSVRSIAAMTAAVCQRAHTLCGAIIIGVS